MAAGYGCDISRPAKDARDAVQWTYLAYLGAVKEQVPAGFFLLHLILYRHTRLRALPSLPCCVHPWPAAVAQPVMCRRRRCC